MSFSFKPNIKAIIADYLPPEIQSALKPQQSTLKTPGGKGIVKLGPVQNGGSAFRKPVDQTGQHFDQIIECIFRKQECLLQENILKTVTGDCEDRTRIRILAHAHNVPVQNSEQSRKYEFFKDRDAMLFRDAFIRLLKNLPPAIEQQISCHEQEALVSALQKILYIDCFEQLKQHKDRFEQIAKAIRNNELVLIPTGWEGPQGVGGHCVYLTFGNGYYAACNTGEFELSSPSQTACIEFSKIDNSKVTAEEVRQLYALLFMQVRQGCHTIYVEFPGKHDSVVDMLCHQAVKALSPKGAENNYCYFYNFKEAVKAVFAMYHMTGKVQDFDAALKRVSKLCDLLFTLFQGRFMDGYLELYPPAQKGMPPSAGKSDHYLVNQVCRTNLEALVGNKLSPDLFRPIAHSLQLDLSKLPNNSCLSPAVQLCQGPTSVTLSRNSTTPEDLAMLTQFSELREVAVPKEMPLKPETLKALVSCPTLRKLTAALDESTSPEALKEAFAAASPNLHTLEIVGKDSPITDKHLDVLLNQRIPLQRLEVENRTVMTPIAMEKLKKFQGRFFRPVQLFSRASQLRSQTPQPQLRRQMPRTQGPVRAIPAKPPVESKKSAP